MKKNLKKISVFLIALMVMVSTSSSFTYATDTKTFNDGDIRVIPINDSEYLMCSNGSSATMKLIDEGEKFIVQIDDPENQGDGYFVVDMDKETLYSSYTGKVFNKSEFISEEEKTINARSVVQTIPKKISYEKLAEGVSDIADSYCVAAFIIAVTALIMGVTIASGPAAVAALIAVAFVVITHGLEAKSSNHGVVVYVDKNKRQKHQGGQVFTFYTYTIGKVGTY